MAAAGILVGPASPLGANTGPTPTTFAVNGGLLTVATPDSASLGAVTVAAPTISSALGVVTVNDLHAVLNGSWTASVVSTAFTTGAGTTNEVIAASSVNYIPGSAVITSGTAVFSQGPGGALNAAETAFSASNAIGANSASWNPQRHREPAIIGRGRYIHGHDYPLRRLKAFRHRRPATLRPNAAVPHPSLPPASRRRAVNVAAGTMCHMGNVPHGQCATRAMCHMGTFSRPNADGAGPGLGPAGVPDSSWPGRFGFRPGRGRSRSGRQHRDGSVTEHARILVVDDDATVADVVGRYLARDGHGVECVRDGYTALRRAADELPDLVVRTSCCPASVGWKSAGGCGSNGPSPLSC